MISRYLNATIAALFLAISPLAASAATYTVQPVFTAAFSPTTFDPIPGYNYNSFGTSQPAILQFDFLVSAGGFAPDQYGFANGVFTITAGPNFSNTSAPGWNPSVTPVIDSNGAVPGGNLPLLSENADLAAQDLKDILIAVATPLTTNPAVDPRFQFGRGPFANYNVGTVYFDYNGGFIGSGVTAKFTQASALYRDGTSNRYIGIVDVIVPEPASLLLAGLGILVAGRSRRPRG